MNTKKPLIKAFRGLFSGPGIFGLFVLRVLLADRTPAADPAADPAAGYAGRVGNKKHAALFRVFYGVN